MIKEYLRELKANCSEMYNEFQETHIDERWKWILRAGVTIDNIVVGGFIEGGSVRPMTSKSCPTACDGAYTEFRNILSSISKESIICFTDGSKVTDTTGSGAVIYAAGSEERLECLAENVNGESNNLISKSKYCGREIHVFTDSMLCKNILLGAADAAKLQQVY